MQVKPKDASLAPPSGKTEVSMGWLLGLFLGRKRSWFEAIYLPGFRSRKTLHQNPPQESAPAESFSLRAPLEYVVVALV